MELKKVIKFKINIKLNHNCSWLEYEPYTKLVMESE